MPFEAKVKLIYVNHGGSSGARGKVFQILVPGDPKGALALAVLASGILGDPGADGRGEGKSKQAGKYGAKEK